MSVEDAFADIEKEGEIGKDAFSGLEKEEKTASDSQPEKKQEEEKPKEGEEVKAENTPEEGEEEPKDVPFHDHPRWKQREEELKTLREDNETKTVAIKELQEFKEQYTKSKEQPSDAPSWFRELYGDNADAWAKYSEYDKQLREDIKRDVLEEQDAKQKQANQAQDKLNKWIDSEFGRLKAEGKEFDRNELTQIMLDYGPTQTDNPEMFDFDKGFKIYEALKDKSEVDPEKAKARKKVGSDATKSSGKTEQSKDFMTSTELRNKSWNEIDK